jgi:ATP-dependent Clp protease ATP-binding subunit ClpA
MLAVARLLLDETTATLARRRVTIEYDPVVPEWLLAQCGMDPQAGARPLRRLVKMWVEDAVADHLIHHRTDGPIHLRMLLSEDRPVVEVVNEVTSLEERS